MSLDHVGFFVLKISEEVRCDELGKLILPFQNMREDILDSAIEFA